MNLIRDGIDNVRVFEIPFGIRANGSGGSMGSIALVRWRSNFKDKLYHVYANGKFAGAATAFDQRQMLVCLPCSFTNAVSIEVFAVPAESVHQDFSKELEDDLYYTGRVKISFIKSHDISLDSTVDIYSDNGSGEIDYTKALNNEPLMLWENWQGKCGFGLSKFGSGDFGFEASAAIGFGKGDFAVGCFGISSEIFEWVSKPMEAGVYKFAVVLTNNYGNSSITESEPIEVLSHVKPPEVFNVLSFDSSAGELIFSVD